MFTQALQTAARKWKSNIGLEKHAEFASTMTWESKGVQLPIEYPNSMLTQFPACFGNDVSNGTQWVTSVPSSCSTKANSPNLKTGK